jgi:hypothetical protein
MLNHNIKKNPESLEDFCQRYPDLPWDAMQERVTALTTFHMNVNPHLNSMINIHTLLQGSIYVLKRGRF